MKSLGALFDVILSDARAKGPRSDLPGVVVFRVGQYARARKRRLPLYLAYRVVDMVWLRMIAGAEIPARATIGPGLRLRHWGRGIVIHPDARIGSNACLYHRVTIGTNGKGVPTLGDKVYVGVGATIIGPVVIGDGARIGAGAVVTADVAPGTTAVGFHTRQQVPD